MQTKNDDDITLASIPDLQVNETLLTSVMKKKHEIEGRSRKRRTVLQRRDEPCHLEPLHVPIQEVGWDVNIAKPEVFIINQCEGRCWHDSSKAYHKQTNHAIIQALYAAVTQGQKASYPCCAPAGFQNGSALIISSSNIKLLILEKLTVTSCECM